MKFTRTEFGALVDSGRVSLYRVPVIWPGGEPPVLAGVRAQYQGRTYYVTRWDGQSVELEAQ